MPDEQTQPELLKLDRAQQLMRELAEIEPDWGTECPTADQVIYLLRAYFDADREAIKQFADEIASTH